MSVGTISIIIITRNRFKILEQSIGRLLDENYNKSEIIIVDSSDNNFTAELIQKKIKGANLRYLFNVYGRRNMQSSRNFGIKYARGDIIAFLDDDSIIRSGWISNILSSYSDGDVGGVGGRIIQSNDPIWNFKIPFGKILQNGTIIGNFFANPEKTVEVDHLPGGNMSFKRHVIKQVGLFDENYTGSNIREETDYCYRVKLLNYKLIFNPNVCVDHLRATQTIEGRSYDDKIVVYYFARNTNFFFSKHFSSIKSIGVLIVSICFAIKRYLKKRQLKNILYYITGGLIGYYKGKIIRINIAIWKIP